MVVIDRKMFPHGARLTTYLTAVFLGFQNIRIFLIGETKGVLDVGFVSAIRIMSRFVSVSPTLAAVALPTTFRPIVRRELTFRLGAITLRTAQLLRL
jgi:hypothetical protein